MSPVPGLNLYLIRDHIVVGINLLDYFTIGIIPSDIIGTVVIVISDFHDLSVLIFPYRIRPIPGLPVPPLCQLFSGLVVIS